MIGSAQTLSAPIMYASISSPGPIAAITRSTISGYAAAHSTDWIAPPEAPTVA